MSRSAEADKVSVGLPTGIPTALSTAIATTISSYPHLAPQPNPPCHTKALKSSASALRRYTAQIRHTPSNSTPLSPDSLRDHRLLRDRLIVPRLPLPQTPTLPGQSLAPTLHRYPRLFTPRISEEQPQPLNPVLLQHLVPPQRFQYAHRPPRPHPPSAPATLPPLHFIPEPDKLVPSLCRTTPPVPLRRRAADTPIPASLAFNVITACTDCIASIDVIASTPIYRHRTVRP